ncbi:SLAM family member 9 [Monodelphis domestica]|uniref:SLAM family member 9 n=1 Tax=Monodelphis domestica TaxID=13616 RepID=F6UAS7_MONDO|nr:SLAM family member 9 [Monodelphis domestica]XP_016285765.1 SLAM family member 9 [Monodelphis domestica]
MAWMKVPPWLFFLVLLGPQEGKGQSGEQEELDSKELMLVLGESVSLPVNIEEGEEIEKIIWSFHSTLAVIQQEAMKEPSISIVPDPRYNVIVNISDHTYSLHISNLSKEDEGTYRAEMNFEGFPGTITQKFILRVYRRLPKPKVTVILEISEESVCNVTLKCHVDGKGDEEEFSWTSLDPGAIVSDGGSVLHLSWRPGDSDWTSTCIVRNPVSFSSHSLPVEQFCTGPKVSSSTSCSSLVKGLFILLLFGFLIVGIIVTRHLIKNKESATRRIHRGLKLRKGVKRENLQVKEFP